MAILTKTKVILLVSLLVTFAAGGSVGVLVSWPKPRRSHWSRFFEELNLTGEQQEQMRKIWEPMRSSWRLRGEKRRALVRERDEAIAALIAEEKWPRYIEILQEYDKNMDELSRQRQRLFEEAAERTRAILNPEQARKYEELRKRWGRRGSHRRWRGPRSRRSSEEPATQRERPSG